MSNNGVLCRYYMRGMCRFGSICRFSHNIPDQQDPDESADFNAMVSLLNAKAKPFVPKQSNNSQQTTTANSTIHQQQGSGVSPSTADGNKSYAEVLGGAVGGHQSRDDARAQQSSSSEMCPYEDRCPYLKCGYLHAEYCDMCGQFRLHPTDKEERRKHFNECIQRHEKDMELSFAIARSQDKTCGVCFDIIMEKSGREQRFGILPNCNHVFCLECIRKWRQAKQFEHKITRACPECRTPSDYVCPSAFWVETKEEKDKLLTDYKAALGEKDCKYFKKGEGKCPFGNKCFYKHALPNGVRVDVGLPQRHIRKLQRSDEEIMSLFDIYLWDFVDQRNYNWLTFDPFDSDDSDWTEDYD